jgi:hypothetical protein
VAIVGRVFFKFPVTAFLLKFELTLWFQSVYRRSNEGWRVTATDVLVVFLRIMGISAFAFGQGEGEDFDHYSIRVTGFWLNSSPTVTLQAAGNNGYIQFDRDFSFDRYSTALGKFDWKLTRKNHIYFTVAPFIQPNQVILNRTVTFRGQTFVVGVTAKEQLQAIAYVPGYQYDILLRKLGHLGIGVQLDLFHTTGKISAAAQVTGSGVRQAAASSSASLLAPLPVGGPEFRLYLTKSPRLFVNGQVFGMYFFGYGNFLSSIDYVGLSARNISASLEGTRSRLGYE